VIWTVDRVCYYVIVSHRVCPPSDRVPALGGLVRERRTVNRCLITREHIRNMLLALAAIASLSFSGLSAVYSRDMSMAHSSLILMRQTPLSRRAAIIGVVAVPFRAAAILDDVTKARSQLTSSEASLTALLDRFDEVTASDGGNGVRRVLGKLGPTSPLFKVDKAVTLVARDMDFDDSGFQLVDDFLGQLDAADGDAYSSIFVPTGGGTTPEYWLGRSKKEVARARSTLRQILDISPASSTRPE
jgi:hypothetical protein